MRGISHNVTMKAEQKILLSRLARRFRRSQNDLIREAIDLLEEKYEKKVKELEPKNAAKEVDR